MPATVKLWKLRDIACLWNDTMHLIAAYAMLQQMGRQAIADNSKKLAGTSSNVCRRQQETNSNVAENSRKQEETSSNVSENSRKQAAMLQKPSSNNAENSRKSAGNSRKQEDMKVHLTAHAMLRQPVGKPKATGSSSGLMPKPMKDRRVLSRYCWFHSMRPSLAHWDKSFAACSHSPAAALHIGL